MDYNEIHTASFFDDIYKKSHKIVNPDVRESVVRLAKLLPKGSAVLDLGSGQGANAIYLAKKGMKVTCIDISKVGLLQTEERAEAMKLDIEFGFCNALDFRPQRKFDAVISIFLTEYLETLEKAKKHIELMKQWTKNGGYNVVASMVGDSTAESDFLFFADNDLLKHYSDWMIDDFEKGRMLYRLEKRVPAYYNEIFVKKPKVSNK